MTATTNKYDARGVSAGKEEVHKAIKKLDKGLFPNAFCKILPDIVANNAEYANIMHADTTGTKVSLAYMYWKETGDLSIWKGIIQDALVMNLDDMVCTGCIDNIAISNTIGRNKHLIPGEVIQAIIEGAVEFIDLMNDHGVNINHAGGETADVGDIVRTIDVGITAFGRLKRDDVIDINLQPGNLIVGLSSYGQSTYENEYNSGIGSNGLTSARHDVLSHIYADKYPESYNPATDKQYIYSGSKALLDKLDNTPLTIGQALLSPTRTYVPVLKAIIDKHRKEINGIVHCTGGAQSKVLHFCENVRIVKDNLHPVPPIFELIQKESGTSLQEMYKVFNMGTRMNIYVPNKTTTQSVIDIANSMNIDAQIIGYVEAADKKEVVVKHGAENIVLS